ncbi:hypothetical protein [Maricaulis maris]|uniref:hypothetical protein n=1 Tax=Maricaulis maris TaxID=74318 RepID=UPI003B8B691C
MKTLPLISAAIIASSLAACVPPAQQDVMISPDCAVYAAFLAEERKVLDEVVHRLPPIILRAEIGADVDLFPDWSAWTAIGTDEDSAATQFDWVFFEPVLHSDRISCSFAPDSGWEAITGEAEVSGWIYNPPAPPRLDAWHGGYGELTLSPVYRSPDRRIALLAMRWDEVWTTRTTEYFHHPAEGTTFVRLQLDENGEWQVTGRVG